jgi:hypothetical protein
MRVGMELHEALQISALADVQLGATPPHQLQQGPLRPIALRVMRVGMAMLVVLSANVQELVLLGATPLRQLPLARQHQIASVVMQAPSFRPLVARARTIALIVPSVSTSM